MSLFVLVMHVHKLWDSLFPKAIHVTHFWKSTQKLLVQVEAGQWNDACLVETARFANGKFGIRKRFVHELYLGCVLLIELLFFEFLPSCFGCGRDDGHLFRNVRVPSVRDARDRPLTPVRIIAKHHDKMA